MGLHHSKVLFVPIGKVLSLLAPLEVLLVKGSYDPDGLRWGHVVKSDGGISSWKDVGQIVEQLLYTIFSHFG